MLRDLDPVAKLFGLPYVPVMPFWPWVGPLGMIPLPSKWWIQVHPPSDVRETPPRAEDQHLVMALADDVRDTIHRGVDGNLRLPQDVSSRSNHQVAVLDGLGLT